MMNNFFAKKGLSFSKNHQPSSQVTHQHKYQHQDRVLENSSQPTYSVPYPKNNHQSYLTPHYQYNNNSFTSKSPQPSQYSYSSYNQSYVSNPIKSKQSSYLQIPNKVSQTPHKRNFSAYSHQKSQYSQEEFKESRNSQYPFVSLQNKTPLNINNVEEGRSMTNIPVENKKEENIKYTSMGNIQVEKNRSTNIKQIKQELLNQGRKDKEGSLRQERSKRDLNESRKNLAVPNSQYVGSASEVNKPRSISALQTPMATSNVTLISSSKANPASSSKQNQSFTTSKQNQSFSKQNQSFTSPSPSSPPKPQQNSSSSYWIQQKIKLMKQIQEKDAKIAQLQKKLSSEQQDFRTKKIILESQKRKAQGFKNRADLQLDNMRKMLTVQRNKNDEAQAQMDKMMFFQDDLIHAKDYSRIKRQLQDVMKQNAQMYQEHQKYILEVAQSRRQLTNRIEQLEVELNNYRLQAAEWRSKIESLNNGAEDKLQMIKLQHDINFLLKKGEQNMEQMMKKQNNLEKAHLQIKQLTEQQNRRNDSQANILDGLSMQQWTSTISLYEGRIADMNDLLQSKNFQVDRQKRTIDCLASQLRKNKEDKMITMMKDKSNQNNLKNELTVLQHSLQSDIQLQTKKISNLEDKLERKVKEVAEKDKFIKEFLLKRVRDIETNSFQMLIHNIKNYFLPQETLTESKESKTTGSQEREVDEDQVREAVEVVQEEVEKIEEEKISEEESDDLVEVHEEGEDPQEIDKEQLKSQQKNYQQIEELKQERAPLLEESSEEEPVQEKEVLESRDEENPFEQEEMIDM